MIVVAGLKAAASVLDPILMSAVVVACAVPLQNKLRTKWWGPRLAMAATVIAVLVGLLVVLQLWLLTATMNAWMGRDDSIVWPAFVASLVCFAFNLYLVRRLNDLAGDGG